MMHGAPLQHAAIFEKTAVQFEEGSLDHVRFYSNEREAYSGDAVEEGHGKVHSYTSVLWMKIFAVEVDGRFRGCQGRFLVRTAGPGLLMVP